MNNLIIEIETIKQVKNKTRHDGTFLNAKLDNKYILKRYRIKINDIVDMDLGYEKYLKSMQNITREFLDDLDKHIKCKAQKDMLIEPLRSLICNHKENIMINKKDWVCFDIKRPQYDT